MIMNRMQDFVMSSCKDFSQRPFFQPLLAAPQKGSDFSTILHRPCKIPVTLPLLSQTLNTLKISGMSQRSLELIASPSMATAFVLPSSAPSPISPNTPNVTSFVSVLQKRKPQNRSGLLLGATCQEQKMEMEQYH